MSDFHDCPRCGKPQSAYGDNYCGKCEKEYREWSLEQARLNYNDYLAKLPEDGGGEHVLSFSEYLRELGL